MRRNIHVECLGEMRRLEPRCDPADARAIDLNDGTGALLHEIAEMTHAVYRFPDSNGDRGRGRKTDMSVEIVGWKRFFHPGKVEGSQRLSAADRLVDREDLIAIGHEFEIIADGRTHRSHATDIRADGGFADLDLHAVEAF